MPTPNGPARALHVLALWSFAVAQPLLDLLGRQAQFFVAQDARPADVAALALALCLLLPAALALLVQLAVLAAPRAGRALHRSVVAVLAAATFLQLLKRLGGLPGLGWLALSLVLGAATAAAYARSPALGTYLSLLAPAPLIFAAAFLFFSPAAQLLWTEPLPPPDGVEAETPVVMVVFDELSLPTLLDESGAIDAARYPHFAALGRRSHWFRNATTTADSTTFALPAILTGNFLKPGKNRDLATAAIYPQNLFRLLGGSYRLNVYESATGLCPRSLCGGTEFDAPMALRLRRLLSDAAVVYPHALLPADLTAGLPEIGTQWGRFARKQQRRAAWRENDRKPRIFASFLAAMRADPGDRTLHFLHSSLPHVPWQYLPSGTSYGATGTGLLKNHGAPREVWTQDRWPVTQGFQRYLLQLGYVDRLLGDLLATLAATGLDDRALVIVTADHGLAFEPGRSRRRVESDHFEDIVSIPLFVKLPYQRAGTVSDRNVELIDVLPTLLEVLGVEPAWPMDGASALDAGAPARRLKRVLRPPYDRRSQLAFDAAEVDARSETVRGLLRLFGPGSDPAGLFRIGPHPDLIGRPLAELEIAAEPRGDLRLDRPEIYAGVDPESGFVPARVLGKVRSPELRRGPLTLAVAIGGVVRAVTRTFQAEADTARFAAMVPEEAFTAGRNRVEVFAVEGTAERPRLVPLARRAGRGIPAGGLRRSRF